MSALGPSASGKTGRDARSRAKMDSCEFLRWEGGGLSRYGVDSDHRGLTSDAFVILPEITTDGFMPVYPLCEHQDFSRVAGASFRGRRLTTAASLILGYGAGRSPVNAKKLYGSGNCGFCRINLFRGGRMNFLDRYVPRDHLLGRQVGFR